MDNCQLSCLHEIGQTLYDVVFHQEKQPVATSEGSKAGRRLNVTEEKEALVRKLWLEGKITALAKMLGLSRQTCHSVLGNSPAGHAQADKSEQYY